MNGIFTSVLLDFYLDILAIYYFQTVIECLRYATTGDQPPNTKGGAFLYDPKV